jgi:hypothetical protein
MIKVNATTRTITCPAGDTGPVVITLEGYEGPDTARALFAVRTLSGEVVLRKQVHLVDDTITVNLLHGDTAALTPGAYLWDVRIVSDPTYDEEGNMVADDADDVDSLFAPDNLPSLIVKGVAANV